MRKLFLFLGLLLGSLACSQDALADKRVALVIGNSAYQHVPHLRHPARDSAAIAEMFRQAGFDTVIHEQNVGNLPLKRAMRRFEDAAQDADIVVVYFSGHGIEIGGTNYLIPVDARLATDLNAGDETIGLDRIVESVEQGGHKKLRLIILDAGRDNPFARTMKRQRRQSSPGTADRDPTATHTLIAFAARAGNVALDGDGAHSPYAAALLKSLTVPGLDIRLAFGRVRDDVMKATNQKQEPFVYGSLGGDNVSLVPAPSQDEVKADYDLVVSVGTRRAYEIFLKTHPAGYYADLARARLAELPVQPDLRMEKRPEPALLPGKRVALVIGNSAYQTVARLPHPSRDANAIAAMFRNAGFTVIAANDVSHLEFRRALRRFEDAAEQAETMVFYFSGHGFESGGESYLVPTDAKLASESDKRDETVSLGRVIDALESVASVKLRLIILDASRENPFVPRMSGRRAGASSGLGVADVGSSGTLVAYSAKGGSVAADGDGEHTPYTAALLKSLAVPGLDVRLAFGRVRDDVLSTTNRRQEPFVYGSLGGENHSLVPRPPVAAAPPR